MKNYFLKLLSLFVLSMFIVSCTDDNDTNTDIDVVDNEDDGDNDDVELHSAFSEFDSNYTDIYLDGDNVVIEASGIPNHTTPYYSENHELYVEPTTTSEDEMTPTRIDTSNRDHEQSLTVSTSPEKANSSTTTELGAVGIAVSGAYIYNDQEGSGDLDQAAGSLDYTGAHIGPDYYHYHLEPKAFSNDDDSLVGIIADGFFIYGRKCSLTGTYPTDLDASGGHTHKTQHSTGDEYHYHIINEVYSTTGSYILFAGPYIGTPNALN